MHVDCRPIDHLRIQKIIISVYRVYRVCEIYINNNISWITGLRDLSHINCTGIEKRY